MSKLSQIEELTGGKASLTYQPANDFFPSPHWFLQTADGGKFGNISKREVIAATLDFLNSESAEQMRGADFDNCEGCGQPVPFHSEWCLLA